MLVFSYLVFKLIGRFLGPVVDKLWGTDNASTNYRKSGRVNVNYKQPPKEEKKVGEYIDFEEVK